MSVAFRREGDDEHKEPRFEIPIAPGPNLVTARGLALIAARVAELDQAIATTADDDAREGLRRDQRYWATRLATARIAPAPDEGEVGIGSRVTFALGGVTRTIAIVGGDEADPAGDRIAFTAPLARAMMGAAAGEAVDYNGTAEGITVIAVEEDR
ncbi:GreA/GreB family elongation factor [Sphingomonas sp.]|uniref:GreA/GreB family elongation factor n=1 Tax=Sphingomonas sp. TaxID=28214 RepID=UPI002BC54730|nr:GreA/GreB family elongation factor [Sphingomonas sp.]HWK36806.1 GreA/GreB family elongation factor [Sphingomonas sp.]